MNIIMKIIYATVETIAMITAVTLPFVGLNVWVVSWYFLCVALGFLLRIGMEHNKNRLTWKSLLYQSICTVSFCFFMYLLWNYLFPPEKQGFEIYIFLCSLFATFLVSQLEDVFEKGVKSWLRIKLGKFLAVESKEENL
jgi:hypothetical protein